MKRAMYQERMSHMDLIREISMLIQLPVLMGLNYIKDTCKKPLSYINDKQEVIL